MHTAPKKKTGIVYKHGPTASYLDTAWKIEGKTRKDRKKMSEWRAMDMYTGSYMELPCKV